MYSVTQKMLRFSDIFFTNGCGFSTTLYMPIARSHLR